MMVMYTINTQEQLVKSNDLKLRDSKLST
jgi:hypothetical protein